MPAVKPTKGEIYVQALDEARRSGRWSENISTPVASNLPWSELVRKFHKHNPSRTVTAEAARVEQLIYTGFQSAAAEAGFGDQSHTADVGYASFPKAGPLRAPKTALPPFIRPRDRDALRQAADKLHSAVESSPPQKEINSGLLVLALADYALEDIERCLEVLRRCDRSLQPNDLAGIEGHEVTLRVMGNGLEGRCCEIVRDLGRAEAAYGSAGQAVTSDRPLLTQKNEIMSAWATDSLYRLALIAGRQNDFITALPAHRSYHAAISRSPSASPFTHSAFYRSYLAILVDSHRANAYTPPQSSKDGSVSKAYWRVEMHSVQQAYEKLIDRTTSFPRAGVLNQPLLDLLDHSFDAWVADGKSPESAQSLIDFHYRAIERTYQSQRILRHFVHLFSAKGNFEDAIRSLRLYDELFSKAKETDARKIAQEVLDYHEGKGDKIEGGRGANEPDFDTNAQYVETILFGIQVLCKHRLRVKWAAELAEKLEEYEDSQETRASKSDIQYARGLACATLAEAMEDPDSRPKDQAKALRHLVRAVELDQQSFHKRYLLAYTQAEMRDIAGATAMARAAVDVGSERPEAWHLLTLLTSATRDWEGALRIADLGLDAGDADGEDGTTEGFMTPEPSPFGISGSNSPIDLRSSPQQQQQQSNGLPAPVDNSNDPSAVSARGRTPRIPAEHLTAPMLQQRLQQPSTYSAPPDDPANAIEELDADGLEAEIELRMTRNALIEILDGPEAALSDQQTLFAIFAEIAPRIAHAAAAAAPAHPPTVNGSGPALNHNHVVQRSASVKMPTRLSIPMQQRSVSAAAPRSVNANGDHTGSFELVDNDVAGDQAPTYTVRAKALLVRLWLLSAGTFRRWGKYDEGRAAIEAAELLNPEAPGVWTQLALYDMALGDTNAATTALAKALALAPKDVQALVELGKLHVANNELALAESVLEEITQGRGWASGAAWRGLGQVCAKTHRPDRARRCLEYALQLEESKPVRPLLDSLPRIL